MSSSSASEPPARRQRRLDAASSKRIAGVRIVLENLTNEGNRAAILRSVEALGLLHVDEVIHQDQKSSTTRRKHDARHVVNGAEKWLHIQRHSSVEEFITDMRRLGVTRVVCAMPPPLPGTERGPPIGGSSPAGPSSIAQSTAVAAAGKEASDGSRAAAPRRPHCALEQINFEDKVALVFGSEGLGISKTMQDACDGSFSVPMHGLTESLNVSVTVAICAHFARRQRLKAVSEHTAGERDASAAAETDLSLGEIESLKEEYRVRSKEHDFVKQVKIQRKREGRKKEEPPRDAPVFGGEGSADQR